MKHTKEQALAAFADALDLLGTRQRDLVTEFKGVVTSVCYDISGCIQVALSPPLDKEGKKVDGLWIDVDRLRQIDRLPALHPFKIERSGATAVRGPAAKPAPR